MSSSPDRYCYCFFVSRREYLQYQCGAASRTCAKLCATPDLRRGYNKVMFDCELCSITYCVGSVTNYSSSNLTLLPNQSERKLS